MRTRPATPDDAEAIARIYNEGIDDRVAPFETEHRSPTDVTTWLADRLPVVVAEAESEVVTWAAAHPYRARPVYDGIGEFSIYVARERRSAGLGASTLATLIEECERRGYWKLVARIFPENDASVRLCRSLGFREVGVYRRHAKLDGEWRDCVVVEKLLGEATS